MSQIKKYKVRIGYSVKECSEYEVLADSEKNALDIAMFRLEDDRRDYADMFDFEPRIIVDEKPDKNLSVKKSWHGI